MAMLFICINCIHNHIHIQIICVGVELQVNKIILTDLHRIMFGWLGVQDEYKIQKHLNDSKLLK